MMKATKYLTVYLLLIFFDSPGILFSQVPSSIISHYSTENGLSHSGIMCIHEDKSGFMWFGTWDGLNKFDGYTFTTYKSKPGDTSSLSHNRIDDIIEDNYGYLWIKTYDEKAHRFNPENETFKNFPGNRFKIEEKDYHFREIIKTLSGDIWLITKSEGCFRCIPANDENNTDIIHYSAERTDSLKIQSDIVKFVYSDKYSNIWISTQNGIRVFSDNKNLNLPETVISTNKYFFSSVYEGDSLIWLGTSEGRLLQVGLKSGKFQIFTLPVSTYISTINEYKENLIIGTYDQGILIFKTKDKKFEVYNKTRFRNLMSNHIESVYIDKHKTVWIETDSAGVVRFIPDNNSFKRFTQKTEKVSPYVYYGDYFNIYEDIHDVLWINLKKGGFCYYNRSKDKINYFYNEPNSPDRKFSNLVTCALSDSKGNLWLSTHSRGLEKISFIDNKFRFYKPDTNPGALSANEVRSVFEDKYGYLWIGTKEGKLFCYKNNVKVREYSSLSGKSGDIKINGMVYCILQSYDGTLWFGTKGDGILLAKYIGNPENLKFQISSIKHNEMDPNSLSHNWIYSIYEDSRNRIWVGTYGGGLNLLIKEEGEIKIYNYNNSNIKYPNIECNQIRHIAEDKGGNIWVGSSNGLVILDASRKIPENYTVIQKQSGYINGLANNDVHYILRDKNDIMWISTFGGGLGKVISLPDDNTNLNIKNYTTLSGLPIDIVLSMLEDNEGNLWLSTEKGISKFNPVNETFTNFSEIDGLRNLIMAEGSAYKSNDGELHFGALDGFYSFYPEEISTDEQKPDIFLVNLQLFNKDVKVNDNSRILMKSIDMQKSITLNYKQSVFSIGYAGIYFQNPEKLEYAFMLEGYDHEWNYVRNQRKATYTNLKAGKYKFRVKCSLTGKYSEAKEKEIEIIILPPPWKTKWAVIAYILIFIILFYITRKIILHILNLKHKVLLEQQLTNLKLKFFTNISHELRTPLSLIIGPIEELLEDKGIREKTREYLEVIDKNARRMLSHINNLLDFRKIQTGKMKLNISEVEIVSFIRDIYEGFGQLAKIRNITFNFISNIDSLNVWLDPEKIDTVIFNLLSNAFKFTPEGKKIDLILKKLDYEDKYQIIIADEGQGISQEELPYIFERFKVSHSTEDPVNKGTGIGLSLVKEIAELHKGEVRVDSIPGSGSVFTVTMYSGKERFKKDEVNIREIIKSQFFQSRHAADMITLETISIHNSAEQINTNISLLIIEDNNDLRNYIINRLSKLYKVEGAEDGLQGFKKAKENIPDLIISDIMMPGYNGIQLVHKLRNEVDTSHIPIILLTARSSVENEIEGLKYGADAYIKKPFKMDYLIVRIQNLLEQRKRLMEKFNNNEMKVVELSPDEIVVTARDEQFIKNVIKTIEENISNTDFNIEQIASAVGMGRTTFFKKLKGLTGMAPVEFLRDIKLKRGYQLIETGEFTVSEIAFKLGFSDAGYFTKCFKEKYNTTPTDLIKQVKENKEHNIPDK